jgi:hypothetical protein
MLALATSAANAQTLPVTTTTTLPTTTTSATTSSVGTGSTTSASTAIPAACDVRLDEDEDETHGQSVRECVEALREAGDRGFGEIVSAFAQHHGKHGDADDKDDGTTTTTGTTTTAGATTTTTSEHGHGRGHDRG